MSCRNLSFIALAPFLAACDPASLKDFQLPWNKPSEAEIAANAYKGPPEVSPLVVPIEVEGGRHAVSTADAKTVNLTQLVAEGPAQSWRVEINGDKAKYIRPGARTVTMDVKRITYADGIEYIGILNESPFALTVTGGKCATEGFTRDWTLAARLKTAGKTHAGCAAAGAADPAGTTGQAG